MIKLSPRTGRPIVGDEPRNKTLGLRVTATTIKKINVCAEITGKTKTELLERMIDALYDNLTKK